MSDLWRDLLRRISPDEGFEALLRLVWATFQTPLCERNAAENAAVLRHIALGLLQNDTSTKLGIKKQTPQGRLGRELPR
jgi:hypothetical protein